jgi:hypothetical protein
MSFEPSRGKTGQVFAEIARIRQYGFQPGSSGVGGAKKFVFY